MAELKRCVSFVNTNSPIRYCVDLHFAEFKPSSYSNSYCLDMLYKRVAEIETIVMNAKKNVTNC